MREALKAKRRSRRKIAAGRAEVEKSSRHRRNDILPLLKIENCSVDALKPHSRQLRKSDSAHVHEIANSISTLGFNVPLLIGKDNVILDGESRLQAAKLLGLSSVPCIRVDHLDETEQRLLRMAVNRLGEKGAWDVGELKAEFEELIIVGAPIEISGFGSDEIDEIVIGNDDVDEDAHEQSQAVDLVPQPGRSAVARVGDLFQLGRHRLMCGDGNDPDVVKRLMQTDVARVVLTDLGFDAAIQQHGTESEQRDLALASGTDPQLRAFNPAWIATALAHLVDGGLLGAFMDWRSLPHAHAAATALGLIAVDLVVWAKPNAEDGDLYRSGHELLPLFKKGTAPHTYNVAAGQRGRHRTNMWTTPAKVSPGSGPRRPAQDPAAEKPTALLAEALIDLTDRGEIVLDPFIGSGSTLIAAENAARVCCGVELDPRYVDLIIRRYEASTGTAAILAESDETFEQVANRRRDDDRRYVKLRRA